jgi:hypothetical protein
MIKQRVFLSVKEVLMLKYLKHTVSLACIWIAVLLFLPLSNILGQQSFRRHFIIAYDISTPFIRAEKNCPSYEKALIALFSNESVQQYNEAYQDNLNVEKKNGLPFFDKSRDEISFFHFNVTREEFNHLQLIADNGNENSIITSFNNCFLKDKNFCWTNFMINGNVNISDYLHDALSILPIPASFGNGVSMSNFVYPLILDRIDSTKYAEEYVLIILSDFLTGSMLGNMKDLDRVRDIYRVPYNTNLSNNSPVSFIKKQIDFLASQYYKIDFFQYSFIPYTTNNAIGIISYKIKPKIGVLTPEDVSLFVDGDLDLNQRGYQNSDFKTSETKIKFTHNENLVPLELRMTVFLPTNAGDKAVFDDIIAQKDGGNNWTSKYTTDKNLMSFDKSSLAYFLPKLKITFDSIINQKDFENLKFIYEFKTKYKIATAQQLNFIYKTERALPIENIHYSTKATIIIMYYLLPILAVVLLLVFLAVYGKPRKLQFNLDGYLDSFEKIDYKTDGKLITPFKAWNCEKQGNVDLLPVKGYIQFKSTNFPFNWNSLIHLKLYVEEIPNGFELFLKHNMNDIKEFSVNIHTTIKKEKKGNLSFVVGIRQTDITKQITTPELVKFSVETVVKDSVGFIKSELRETVDYKFHIGADLQDVWVSFDPGTTGSCVAVGSASENIIICEDGAKNKIIPSVIAFDKSANFHLSNSKIPESIYDYGTIAERIRYGKKGYIGFRSIKKLLGFKDKKEIVFNNGNSLNLKGKDMASLLVKGLYKDVNAYFNRLDFNADDYKRNGLFSPLRAVVAIPNNFTASKIQDMIDCIANLNQFKEIRYVYEAEAVLFYYLSNFSKFNPKDTSFDSETVLVFDMGGATINATIVTSYKTLVNNRIKYDIDFLGKIGYGIGGDTIDYCISKFILSFTDEFPALKSINILDKKNELAELAYGIKVEIVRNFGESYLITAYNLQNFINGAFGLSILINEEESNMYQYFKKSQKNNYKLFEHKIFTKTIYNNIKDAIDEVIGLSGNITVDKVIFSGRSSFFPMVKETVEKQLKAKENNITSIALNLEESKTAVAKGACWYGINKSSVQLNNLKTNASFGFKKTLSADQTDVKFYELIEMGCDFDATNDGINFFEGFEEITDDFAFDGNKVNFYQVMGKDADEILSKEQKHKYSKIATITLDQISSLVAMQVNENDEVDCRVRLQSNRILIEKGVVADQEIDEANEEHYTWMVK